jgi:hypothetical protein
MKRSLLTLTFLLTLFFAFTTTAFAIPPLEWILKSTNNGSPQQRTFVFSPKVNIGTASQTSQVQTWLNVGNEQVIEGYVGSGVWSYPWFNANQWYTIKSKQTSFPCTETVFRVYFLANHEWTVAPTMEWKSGGALGSYGRMFMNGGSYPSTYSVGTTYTTPTYRFRWDTVYNCEPLPIDKELSE